MVDSFARVGAMHAMRVEDYYAQGRRSWLRLHEKGGKQHEMPAHHYLEAYIDAYVEAAGIADRSSTTGRATRSCSTRWSGLPSDLAFRLV